MFGTKVIVVAIVVLIGGAAIVLTNKTAGAFSLTGLFNALVVESGVSKTAGVAYGPLPRHRLDIYRPKSGNAGGPIAFFIYGGGWKAGERTTYRFVGHALASRGITTVVSDYRLFPNVRFPDFVKDASLAYRWTHAKLAIHDGVRRPIVVIGHSAGAHIGALLTLDSRYRAEVGLADLPPAAFVGLAGPYAFNPVTYKTTKDIFAGVKDHDQARPVNFVTKSSPPMLLFHGLSDDTVKPWNTRELTARARESGVAVTKRELKGVGHVGLILTIARPFRWRAPVLEETVQFVNSVRNKTAAQPTAAANP